MTIFVTTSVVHLRGLSKHPIRVNFYCIDKYLHASNVALNHTNLPWLVID